MINAANSASLPWGVYARVSSEEQLDGQSIDAQLHALRTWANEKGYAVREFVDEGKSAYTENLDKRPAFKDSLEAVRAHTLAGIAVTHIDRFSRKLIVTLQALGELGKCGAGFVSLENTAFDFSRPADRLMLVVLGAFAEYYSAELSRKVKRGLLLRASKGLHVGTLPYGYCNANCPGCDGDCALRVSSEKGTPIILHPTDAQGVRTAFELYHTGSHTDNTIADALNAQGFRSRTLKGRELWNKNSVRWMLTNLTYAGLVVVKGQTFQGNHPAIITRQVFDEVQQIRAKHLLQPRSSTPNLRTYLFGGILICSGCGHVMNAMPYSGKRLRGYMCRSADRRRSNCKRQRRIVRAELIEEQFGNLLKDFKFPAGWQAQILRSLTETNSVIDPESECRRLTAKLERIKILFQEGDKTLDEYRRERDAIRAQIEALNAPRANETLDAGMLLESLGTVWEAATLPERKEIVMTIVTRAICDPDQKRLIAFFVKPVFAPFFRQQAALREHSDGAFEFVKSI